MGRLFVERLMTRADLFELFVKPAFALTVFTIKGPDGITKRVYEKIEAEKKIFLSSAVVGGTFVLRVVSGLPTLREQDINDAFDILVEAAEHVNHQQA